MGRRRSGVEVGRQTRRGRGRERGGRYIRRRFLCLVFFFYVRACVCVCFFTVLYWIGRCFLFICCWVSSLFRLSLCWSSLPKVSFRRRNLLAKSCASLVLRRSETCLERVRFHSWSSRTHVFCCAPRCLLCAIAKLYIHILHVCSTLVAVSHLCRPPISPTPRFAGRPNQPRRLFHHHHLSLAARAATSR